MKHTFIKIGLVIQVFLICAHLYNNRHGLPIPDKDSPSNELLELMSTYEIEYSVGKKHTLDQTIWGYDLTWASFVLFTVLTSLMALHYASGKPGVGKYVAGGNVVLWLLCFIAAFIFWSLPQQLFFGVLFLMFLLSYVFDWRGPKPNNTRVCIVGGGISGLTAAYELGKKGYINVTVLEKANYLGGKCRTKMEDGYPFDLGGHEMLAGYTDVVAIGEELNAPTRRSIPPLVYDSSKKAYLNFSKSATASGKYSLLQVGWGALRYLWLVGVTFRSHSRPSASFKNLPHELTLSLDEWLNHRNLNAIRDILVFVIKVQGYGQFNTTPACYLVKFMGWRNWLSLLLSGMGIYEKWPRVFVYGMENLCDRLAATCTDVRKNSSITRINRKEDAATGGVHVYLEGKSEPVVFDRLIISTPVEGNSLSYLDLTINERELFSRFSSYKFYTTLCTVEGLAPGVVASNPMNNIQAGEYTGYIKDFSDEPYAIFFSLALNDSVTGEVVKEKIKDVLKNIIPYQGVQPRVLEFINQRLWHYFPHISKNVADTFNTIEALQGKKNTVYASSALTFECVGNSVAYSKRIVAEHF
jgi:predicted NAD/FAD-binding protein